MLLSLHSSPRTATDRGIHENVQPSLVGWSNVSPTNKATQRTSGTKRRQRGQSKSMPLQRTSGLILRKGGITMTTWLYQMNQESYPPERYRVEVWEKELMRWPRWQGQQIRGDGETPR